MPESYIFSGLLFQQFQDYELHHVPHVVREIGQLRLDVVQSFVLVGCEQQQEGVAFGGQVRLFLKKGFHIHIDIRSQIICINIY